MSVHRRRRTSSSWRLASGSAAALALFVVLAQPARVCRGNPSSNLDTYGNSHPVFNRLLDTTVVLKFTDGMLNRAQNFQLGFFNAASNGAAFGAPVTLQNLGWSRSPDLASFTPFMPSFTSGTGNILSFSYNVTPIVTVPGPGHLGSPFFVSYTIPAGTMSLDDVLCSNIMWNSDASQTVPAPANWTVSGSAGGRILNTRAILAGGELTRDNTAIPEPSTLALLLAAVAFAVARLRTPWRPRRCAR